MKHKKIQRQKQDYMNEICNLNEAIDIIEHSISVLANKPLSVNKRTKHKSTVVVQECFNVRTNEIDLCGISVIEFLMSIKLYLITGVCAIEVELIKIWKF